MYQFPRGGVCFLEPNTLEIGRVHPCTVKLSLLEMCALHVSASKIGTAETAVDPGKHFPHVGFPQVRSVKADTRGLNVAEVSSPQITAGELREAQVASLKHRATQITGNELHAYQIASSEVESLKVLASEYRSLPALITPSLLMALQNLLNACFVHTQDPYLSMSLSLDFV